MICKWCSGTNEECGCGYGSCAHCNNGEVADPPFGPKEYMSGVNYDKPRHFFSDILKDRKIIDAFEYVSIYMFGEQLLSDAEINMIKNYWNDSYRDETIGDVLRRVAYHLESKYNDR